VLWEIREEKFPGHGLYNSVSKSTAERAASIVEVRLKQRGRKQPNLQRKKAKLSERVGAAPCKQETKWTLGLRSQRVSSAD